MLLRGSGRVVCVDTDFMFRRREGGFIGYFRGFLVVYIGIRKVSAGLF